MAYVQQQSFKERAASLGTVAALHAGVGIALVYGLAASGVIEKAERIAAFDIDKPKPIPIEPPPPPPEPPEAKENRQQNVARPTVAQEPPIRLDTNAPDIPTSDVILPPLPPIPDPGPTGLPNAGTTPLPSSSATATPTPTPTPKPAPTFEPVAAKPSNSPSGWVTNADYPYSSIRQEEEGITRFRLSVSTSGKVTDCTVTAGSGSRTLDRTTCSLASKRARFTAARGSDGKPVAGSFESAVRWVLPER